VDRYNQWGVDELIYIDISPGTYNQVTRADLATPFRDNILDIIKDVSKRCFMPLTFGGGIRTLDDIQARLSRGADKVTINTKAVEDPNFISQSAKQFGSQCIIVSIDAKRSGERTHIVYKGGREATSLNVVDWAKTCEELGAGEIFLNSIDCDGAFKGYDLELIKKVSEKVNIPVIACGGVGEWQHLVDGVNIGKASAVAAANAFSHKEQSLIDAKRFMYKAGVNVRKEGL
jgi:cyclase